MHRVVPLPARQLWGHAPRVRSFNRFNRRRTFATVAGAERYATMTSSLMRNFSNFYTDHTM
jgi:hypothetical protein